MCKNTHVIFLGIHITADLVFHTSLFHLAHPERQLYFVYAMDGHEDAGIPPENNLGRSTGPSSSSSAELASLIMVLTATVNKLTTVTNDPPPAKRCRPAEDEPDCDLDSEEEGRETETAGKTNTFELSEETKTLLQTCFSLPRPANNKTHKAWITQFGVPQGEETRCSNLDTIISNELHRDALEADRKLSQLQYFLLDAVGPLAASHDDLVSTDDPDPDHIQQAIQLALRILGNASAQFSQERRSKALARLNPNLKPLVDDEDFSKSAPFLFGPGFEKKAKERSEAVTCLRKAANAPKKGVGP